MSSERYDDNEHDDEFDAARSLEEIMQQLLSGGDIGDLNMNAEQLAKAAGLPGDAGALSQMMNMLRAAMSQPTTGDGIDWGIARRTAIEVAGQGPADEPGAVKASTMAQLWSTASLWLDEATIMGAPADAPREIKRVEWVQQSIDTWISMADPVASSISKALTGTMREHLPEELQSALGGASEMLERVGGTLFAIQLGQIVGSLAREVLSGGDIGIPLFHGADREGGTLLTQNTSAFAKGLEQSETDVLLFLGVRELAHARLFRHSRWLRSHLQSAITEYASGINISMEHFEDLAFEFDPSEPEQLQELLRSGSLIPPKTDRQEAAHERLETMLALIDGWVDVVTREASARMPGGLPLAEMIRRRRAAGGPSERAFATLVGLELRPRHLREAAAMWQQVSDVAGHAVRDGLWAHPDLMPTIDEIRDPALLLERLGLLAGSGDTVSDFDRELEQLLDEGLDGLDGPTHP